MNKEQELAIDIFAEWLRRQGHHVCRTASSHWFNQGPRVYQAFPYHWLIHPSEEELFKFIIDHKAIGLRYSTSLNSQVGSISYHAVYEKPHYIFDDLGKWARKNVRRGLKNCKIEAVSFERLAEEGWQLQVDTLNRQGRRLKVAEEDWRQRCLAAADLPGFEAWGALVQGRLAASVITYRMGDCCYMLYQQCHRDYLAAHVNNALSFEVTRTMIGRQEVRSILYGLHSLDAPESVDEFKFRMGYRARPVRQRVVFHPWLSPVIIKASYVAVKQLSPLFRGNPILAKTEGMLRFYLQGNRPLTDQDWPNCLVAQRAEIIENNLTC